MNYFDAIILGIVEGFTEFLPISSTGHLILVSSFLNIPVTDFLKSFEIVIQLGAILAVVFLYTNKIFKDFELIKKVLVAFLPTAIIGLVFYKIIKMYFLENILLVLVTLFVGGIIILFFDRWERKQNILSEEGLSNISYKQAFSVGVFQALALIPGVSRSGATIVGGRLIKISRLNIVEFSFLLSIPTMMAASGLDILKNYKLFTSENFEILAVGFIVSFLVALLAIKGFLSFVQKKGFAVFGWYRIFFSLLAWYFLF